MATKLEIGDQIRHKPSGQVGVLEYVNAKTKRQRDRDDEYWGEAITDDYRTIDIDSPDDVVLVYRAADIPAKVLPTSAELVDFLGSALLDQYDEIEVTETDRNGEPEGELLILGNMGNGARFGARVKVTEIEWVDF